MHGVNGWDDAVESEDSVKEFPGAFQFRYMGQVTCFLGEFRWCIHPPGHSPQPTAHSPQPTAHNPHRAIPLLPSAPHPIASSENSVRYFESRQKKKTVRSVFEWTRE
ncbi:hypothetical protein KPH14_011591 [Odynerus spinipes]|uniref:Uncharacterized protein n=1 Tax=Odynerus spinipes TaxID=1348599 RepID=A0AAD9RI27_9HYME|nr:hypothetical protein KPH14_011591 [Odynerus spinipes]